MALIKADVSPIDTTTGALVQVLRPANPFAEAAAIDRANPANDSYGFCSIEDFPPGIGDLSQTHDDVWGFYDYVDQFDTPNFWFKDGNVLSWIFGEQYDNWQDFYGFDACKVVYFSGHGNMDGNGVFSAPMGGTWGGTSWIRSTDMRLGNEMARYLFWSTCLSLRVHDGHSPIRTWGPANLGLRMIFGFEDLSVDDGNYGRYFFQEWNEGTDHSFSDAWLDASWRISTSQSPSVTACGATQAEAQDRVFNERQFFGAKANTSWWWWRWYDAARRIAPSRPALPAVLSSARLAGPDLSAARIAELAETFGVRLTERPEVPPGARGVEVRSTGDGPTLTVLADGTREVRFARADGSGREAPGGEEAVRLAQQAVESFGLADNVDLISDRVRQAYTAGASRDETVDPRATETTVLLTQVVNGLPIVTPGVGEVRVSVDGAGTVTRIVDATRPVLEVSDRAAASAPPEPDGAPARRTPSTVDEVLDGRVQRLARRLAAGGRVPTSITTVPESTEVGYAVRGNECVLVARRIVEVDCGQGLRKRFVIEEPLAG